MPMAIYTYGYIPTVGLDSEPQAGAVTGSPQQQHPCGAHFRANSWVQKGNRLPVGPILSALKLTWILN